MYSTSELDELFLILNSIEGFKLDNHSGATQHYIQVKKAHYHLQTIQTCIAIIAFQLTPQTQKT